jgi:hypothetical protein
VDSKLHNGACACACCKLQGLQGTEAASRAARPEPEEGEEAAGRRQQNARHGTGGCILYLWKAARTRTCTCTLSLEPQPQRLSPQALQLQDRTSDTTPEKSCLFGQSYGW